MKIEEVIKICKDRNELDFLFSITKHIAETDSIGESYGYCHNYTLKQFNNAEKHIDADNYCQYLEEGGIPIYELYLYQIGAVKLEKEINYDI